jgi:hypothetical protein
VKKFNKDKNTFTIVDPSIEEDIKLKEGRVYLKLSWLDE